MPRGVTPGRPEAGRRRIRPVGGGIFKHPRPKEEPQPRRGDIIREDHAPTELDLRRIAWRSLLERLMMDGRWRAESEGVADHSCILKAPALNAKASGRLRGLRRTAWRGLIVADHSRILKAPALNPRP